MSLKNYEPELQHRLKKALKPYAQPLRQHLAQDEALRHKAGAFHMEAAEDFYDAMRGKIVESNGSDEAVAEFIRWNAHDPRLIKGAYAALQDLLEIARERNGQLFRPTAIKAAEAALAVVNSVADEAQRQWNKVCADAGEPLSQCRFVRERCAELQTELRGLIESDDRFGLGTLSEFCD
jgi:hypothetical protein